MGLAVRGMTDLAFFALPFVARKPREILFAHRPEMTDGAPSVEVAAALGASFTRCQTPDAIPPDAADIFLIVGAGLLPPSFVTATRGRVLNSHPGLIPLVRGLDAFKWAILDQKPIGNTLHYIDEAADAGDVVASVRTPIFPDDTLEGFARRHYEIEIAMMVQFDQYIASGVARPALDGGEIGPARLRMPAERQAELGAAFEVYKSRFCGARVER